MSTHGILVALDESEAAERTLRYVADLAAGSPGIRIHLLHLLRPVPPDLLEHGGSENAAEEARLEKELREKLDRWISEAEAAAQPLFEKSRSTLQAGGIDAGRISTTCRTSIDEVAVARDCIEVAKENGCDTIAVGRNALPWHRELFHRHASDDLVKHGEGFTIWVVE